MERIGAYTPPLDIPSKTSPSASAHKLEFNFPEIVFATNAQPPLIALQQAGKANPVRSLPLPQLIYKPPQLTPPVAVQSYDSRHGSLDLHWIGEEFVDVIPYHADSQWSLVKRDGAYYLFWGEEGNYAKDVRAIQKSQMVNPNNDVFQLIESIGLDDQLVASDFAGQLGRKIFICDTAPFKPCSEHLGIVYLEQSRKNPRAVVLKRISQDETGFFIEGQKFVPNRISGTLIEHLIALCPELDVSKRFGTVHQGLNIDVSDVENGTWFVYSLNGHHRVKYLSGVWKAISFTNAQANAALVALWELEENKRSPYTERTKGDNCTSQAGSLSFVNS